MKQPVTLAIIGVLGFGLLLGCNASNNNSRPEQPTPTPVASPASSNSASEIDRVLGITASLKPTYKVLKVEDVSTGTASRKVVHVSLTKGMQPETVESNLRYAVKETYEKGKADAIKVHGYLEGRTIDASNVVGSITFAPYGDWGRASEKPSLDQYKAVFEGRNPYLPPVKEEAPDADGSLEKQALAGDYQAQRNLAYYLSTGAEGHTQNPVAGCAWRIVILQSRHAKADASDGSNKTFDCESKLNPQQLREAEAQAAALLKKIKKH